MFDKGCDSDEIIGTSKMEVENACLKEELALAVAHICTLDPGLNYKPMNGNSDHCMVTSPTSILVIGLQELKKGVGFLPMAIVSIEGSFSFLRIGKCNMNRGVMLSICQFSIG